MTLIDSYKSCFTVGVVNNGDIFLVTGLKRRSCVPVRPHYDKIFNVTNFQVGLPSLASVSIDLPAVAPEH